MSILDADHFDPHKWWCEDHNEGWLLDNGNILDHLDCRLEVFAKGGSNNFGGRAVARALGVLDEGDTNE